LASGRPSRNVIPSTHTIHHEEASMKIPRDTYDRIEAEIASDTSPVGIDAKKTHVLILHRLQVMEERLERIEAALRSS
jgi:hypothetical protein